LNYSEVEFAQTYSQIKNEIIRGSLLRFSKEFHHLDRLYIGTIGDMPSNSGLGSSSAFACALDLALSQLTRNEALTPEILAKRACELEIEILKKPIGIQDQWATAKGGLRWYDVSTSGKVTSGEIELSTEQKQSINSSLLLVDSGNYRNAEQITLSYSNPDKNQEKLLQNLLEKAKKFSKEIATISTEDIPSYLGEQLAFSWDLKKRLSNKITSNAIDDLYQELLSLGCLGGKISGAGGGGYLLMVVPADLSEKIKSHLTSLKILFESPNIYEEGTEVLINC
jgi:D-glycero-alpha-D-manno-heptose-7-phosphate kinase